MARIVSLGLLAAAALSGLADTETAKPTTSTATTTSTVTSTATTTSTATMTSTQITVCLSILPSAFGQWSDAAVKNWGQGANDRVHVAAEKPLGTSIASADQLHKDILGPACRIRTCTWWITGCPSL